MKTVDEEYDSIIESFIFSLKIYGGSYHLARKLYISSQERVIRKTNQFREAKIAHSPCHIQARQQIERIYANYLESKYNQEKSIA